LNIWVTFPNLTQVTLFSHVMTDSPCWSKCRGVVCTVWTW